MRLDEGDQSVDVVDRNRHAFGVEFDPRVARCGIELGAAWRLCQLPAERMFAAPRSDQQDIHVSPFSRYGVRRWHRSAAVSRGGAGGQCACLIGQPIVGGDQADGRGRLRARARAG